MLTTIRNLFEELNKRGIRYCHWKSNASLAEALSGQTDIDLLIHRKDDKLFRSILSQLWFRPAITTDGEAFPSMEHQDQTKNQCGKRRGWSQHMLWLQ